MFTLAVIGILIFSSVIYAARRGPMVSLSDIWTLDTIDDIRIPPEDREKIAPAKSRLYRNNDELCMEIDTRALPEGAHTVWWVVFDDPDNCENGSGFLGARCGGGRPGDPRTVIWFAGGIVGPNGEGHFNNCITIGAVNAECRPGGDCVVNNPKAEIHAIIGRYHGLAQYEHPEALGEQISMFNGYCEEAFGDAGCPDLQIAIHAK
jgi:hypothetical protein